MTVRIAETLGLKKILSLSKKLEIYDEIPELLSVSLGSAETFRASAPGIFPLQALRNKQIKLKKPAVLRNLVENNLIIIS